MNTVSVAALMSLSSPGMAPATAQQAPICPPGPRLESHARIANATTIRWYSNLINTVDFQGKFE
jgi:hypothetical protein